MNKSWGFGLVVLLLLMFILSGCTSSGYETINTEQAKQLIDAKSVEIIDVRTPEEYAAGHVPGSKLLPLQEIDTWYSNLDPNKKYLMVCRSGNRSGQASDYLAGKGFTHIVNMAGGMNNWTYEVVR
jgi:rhodanese-related sulfurtransferase